MSAESASGPPPRDTLPYARSHPPPAGQWTRGKLRLVALMVLVGCAGVLGVATWLKPDARGYGTHQQLRMAPCGMLVAYGIPCPTCGMTTAFAHTVRGQWLRAARVQFAGFIFALGAAAAAGVALITLIRGAIPRVIIRHVTPFRVFMTMLALLLGGWLITVGLGLADGTFPVRTMKS